jgi:kynureninase
LSCFDEIGALTHLTEKRDKITSYLENVLHQIDKEVDSTFEIIATQQTALSETESIISSLHGEGQFIRLS